MHCSDVWRTCNMRQYARGSHPWAALRHHNLVSTTLYARAPWHWQSTPLSRKASPLSTMSLQVCSRTCPGMRRGESLDWTRTSGSFKHSASSWRACITITWRRDCRRSHCRPTRRFPVCCSAFWALSTTIGIWFKYSLRVVPLLPQVLCSSCIASEMVGHSDAEYTIVVQLLVPLILIWPPHLVTRMSCALWHQLQDNRLTLTSVTGSNPNQYAMLIIRRWM